MAAGVGKTYRMLQEGRASAGGGPRCGDRLPRDPRARRDGRPGRGPRDPAAPGGVSTAAHGSRRWTCPRSSAARRSCAWSTSWPTRTRRASSTPSATRTSRTCSTPGIDVFSTVNVQHLESLNDQVAELTGVRVRETFPDQVLAAADEVVLVDLTPEALIAAAARGQGLSAGARAHGAEQLLPRGEPVGAAGGGAAPGGRGRGGQAPRHAGGGAGHAARRRCSGRRRSPWRSGCWRWCARATPPSGSCGGPGARASAWRADLDLLYVAPPGAPPEGRGPRGAGVAAPARVRSGRLASGGGGRPRGRGRGAGGRRARHHLRADGPRRGPGAGRAAWRSRSPEGLLRRLPGVDVRIVADPRCSDYSPG